MNRTTLRSLVAGVFALAVVVALGGCETVKGAGKDVQHVGEAGERAISK